VIAAIWETLLSGHREPVRGRIFDPAVPFRLEFQSELLASGFDDAAIHEHVDSVGRDIVQQALVVSHQQDRPLGAAQAVDAVRNDPQGVDVKPESVSSRIASLGSSTAIWNTSLRFFLLRRSLHSRRGS